VTQFFLSATYEEPDVPIPKECLSSIQMAGAAVHAADTALKSAVQAYADHVRQSMSQNPFDLNTDSLFEEWKTVARLSQTLEQIEAELRKVHQAALSLGQGILPTANVSPRLRAPSHVRLTAVTDNIPVLGAIEATDVVAKTARKVKQAAAKPIATIGADKVEAKSNKKKSKPKSALSPNTQKLWDQLKTVLNAKKFTAIKRTKIGLDAGLPTGSVTASFTKLLENAYLEEDASGGLKLTSKK
jgi:hypothetical protein